MTGRAPVMDRSQDDPADRPPSSPVEPSDSAGPTRQPGSTDSTAGPGRPVKRSMVKRSMVGLIHLYQMLSANRPPSCRYTPSCSHYAVEAIEVHGVARGSWLAAKRLGRCRPFGSFGYDPVPERRIDGDPDPGSAPAVDPHGPAGPGGPHTQ